MNLQNDAQCPKVLIIEDDPGHQKLLQNLIEKTGCNCDCADEGRYGVMKAISNDYDLIFVDIHIPNLDGFVVVTTLRERGIIIPMIAVTALLLDGVVRDHRLLVPEKSENKGFCKLKNIVNCNSEKHK